MRVISEEYYCFNGFFLKWLGHSYLMVLLGESDAHVVVVADSLRHIFNVYLTIIENDLLGYGVNDLGLSYNIN